MTALPILLPPGFSPSIRVGEAVLVGQTLAFRSSTNEEIINIPKALGVSLRKVKKVLKKNPGDAVEVGETIALKKSFLGFEQNAIISKIKGTVARYERDSGNLVIHTSYDSLTEKVVSPVDGTIALCDNEKIVIHTEKNVIIGTHASGATSAGEIFVLETSFQTTDTDPNLLYQLNSNAIGKIIVGKQLTRDVLVKGIGVGAVGIIGVGVAEEDMLYLNNKQMKTPVIVVDQEAGEKLRAWHGKKVFLNSEAKAIIFLQL